MRISKARCDVRAACACSKGHISCVFPRMHPRLEHCREIWIEKERRGHRVIIQDGDDDIFKLIHKGPLNEVILILLLAHLGDAVIANFIDGDVP